MCQRCQSSPNIKPRSANDAYMKMWEMKANELLDKRKGLSTRRLDSGPFWTFVERVQYYVDGQWVENREHILERSYHYTIARLLCTIVVCRIRAGEDVATGKGLSSNLDEEGGEEVATVLVPEVEVKVRHYCRACLAQLCDFLDDRRTGGKISYSRRIVAERRRTKGYSYRSRLRIETVMRVIRGRVRMTYV
jgi:hypothetical protein